MFFLNRRFVEDSPAKAGFEFHTADETTEEAAQKPTLGFVLRKVFASRAAWLIALSSMCIGMVRNSIDHWWSRYIGAVFHLTAAQRATFAPYNVVTWGTPVAAIARRHRRRQRARIGCSARAARRSSSSPSSGRR